MHRSFRSCSHWAWSIVCCLAIQAIGRAQDPLSWQAHVSARTQAIAEQSAAQIAAITADDWAATQTAWRYELQEMLGLAPFPERTELKATTTGSVVVDGVTVDRLHYQSRPGLYVAANLYIPTSPQPEAGWPAVLYVCGHARVSSYGRSLGNKTQYQHHGLWLARQGVVCLTIDTIQLGEFHGEHHGTYKLGRWDWLTRGYTPAGVETWNAIRGIDLLCQLPYVNAQRIGITGRSGGGAYSWFCAALDERIRVAVPVAGITDLHNHVIDGCVEGHCDCMYFVNYFGLDYGKLAALLAPRPLLLANSDHDEIFPLDGVMRIHAQLAHLYRRLAAEDKLGLLITPGPHQDTQELQVGAFNWLLRHLTEDEPGSASPATKEIAVHELAVFEAEIPQDERVTSVSSWFVDEGRQVLEPAEAAEKWHSLWLPEMRRLNTLPVHQTATFTTIGQGSSTAGDWQLLAGGRREATRILRISGGEERPAMVHLLSSTAVPWTTPFAVEDILQATDVAAALQLFPQRTHYFVRWSGAGWLADSADVSEQHQLLRRLYLLGETFEKLMLQDLVDALVWIGTAQPQTDESTKIDLSGRGRQAALIELAGLLAADQQRLKIGKLYIAGRSSEPLLAPALLGLLRVCDFESLHAAASHMFEIEEQSLESASEALLVDTRDEPQQASGMRIVEVTQDKALFWVRATRWPLPNLGDLPKVEFELTKKGSKKNERPILPQAGVAGLRFAVPGVPAQVRVGLRQSGDWRYSAWQPVDASSDCSALIEMHGLSPGTGYDLRTQVRSLDAGQDISSTLSGHFKTLPAADSLEDFKLAVGTCQAFDDRDGPHGFDVYRTLLARGTDAFVMAGDVVYYDALARSTQLAYYHWQRTYGLPTLLEFHKQVPTYFLKDDHDTYMDDTWPGTSLRWTGEFTFEDGQRIFSQQTGLPKQGYRTLQVSEDLQIWLMEGRDYRSPNDAPDGPDKSIWGRTQKAWLNDTLAKSTAKFRVIISPTPLVGPDRDNKRDNHSNRAFAHEGRQVRQMLASYPNTVVVCGDRHWQYHSIDPETGLHEFSVGPMSDRHAGGWNQADFRPEIHQYLRVAGGYLEIDLSGDRQSRVLKLRHLDTHGNQQHSFTLQ